MKKLRITATTAMFINGLARIIRDEFDIHVIEHECWTIDQIAEWTQCGSPGNCPFHSRTPSEQSSPCYEHEITVYLATGHLREPGYGKTELRARIEYTHNDAMGELYRILLWAKRPDGQITRGAYGLLSDGSPYQDGVGVPENPPRRIAFWRCEKNPVMEKTEA